MGPQKIRSLDQIFITIFFHSVYLLKKFPKRMETGLIKTEKSLTNQSDIIGHNQSDCHVCIQCF
jgi:hypothetical protein